MFFGGATSHKQRAALQNMGLQGPLALADQGPSASLRACRSDELFVRLLGKAAASSARPGAQLTGASQRMLHAAVAEAPGSPPQFFGLAVECL